MTSFDSDLCAAPLKCVFDLANILRRNLEVPCQDIPPLKAQLFRIVRKVFWDQITVLLQKFLDDVVEGLQCWR